MKYFKDDAGNVYAYATDGSEDEFIVLGLASISEAEANALRNPVQPVDALIASLHEKVNAEYRCRMSAIADGYPQYERESWPVQLQEARAYQAQGAAAATPWIDGCAGQRGMTRDELVQRILAKDAAYCQVSGFLTGVRQWHEDAINAIAEGDEAQARDDLAGYDTKQGWEMPQALPSVM